MYLISGCLLGHNCKYSGGNNLCGDVKKFAEEHSFFAVCPETAGKLPVPRPPAERRDGGVFDKDGRDVTYAFVRGSEKCMEDSAAEARRCGETIEGAVLKARSPSCGRGVIYDGTFTGRTVPATAFLPRCCSSAGFPCIRKIRLGSSKIS